MNVSKWAYTPEKCDGQPCHGDCDHCAKQSLYEMMLSRAFAPKYDYQDKESEDEE